MTTAPYTFTRGVDYPAIVATSQKVEWTVDDVFRDRRFDAAHKIIPDSWVRTQHLTFLTTQEQRTLNHLRAFSYVHLFGNYEEFIPMHLIELAQQDWHGDRAPAGFAAFWRRGNETSTTLSTGGSGLGSILRSCVRTLF
jgi:hypothetical protein